MPWPSGLPKLSLTENFEEILGDGSYRTETDSGSARTRPRPDAPNDMIPFRQRYNSEQIDILTEFYKTTLVKGSLPFNDFHPRTGEEVTFKFKGPPRFPREGGIFNAMFTLEIMP